MLTPPQCLALAKPQLPALLQGERTTRGSFFSKTQTAPWCLHCVRSWQSTEGSASTKRYNAYPEPPHRPDSNMRVCTVIVALELPVLQVALSFTSDFGHAQFAQLAVTLQGVPVTISREDLVLLVNDARMHVANGDTANRYGTSNAPPACPLLTGFRLRAQTAG